MQYPDELDQTLRFDDDYLYFSERQHSSAKSRYQAEVIRRILDLQKEHTLLDIPCGYGRISNILASVCQVTGIDLNPVYVSRAGLDAQVNGVTASYLCGDMRQLVFHNHFDKVLCWFSSFGYFDDDTNRQILVQFRQALKPEGLLMLEHINLPHYLTSLGPTLERETTIERDGNVMLLSESFDILTNRNVVRRTVSRAGEIRELEYFIRMFTCTEIKYWLEQSGFVNIRCYGRQGIPLTIESERVIVIAQRG